MCRRVLVAAALTMILVVAPTVVATAAAGISPPTGLTATAVSAREVVLDWNPVDRAIAYRVYWGIDPGLMEYLDETTQTTYRHPYLGPATTYVYAVQAVSRKGISALSPVVYVTTPPEPPAGLTAEVIKADEVRLSWSPGRGATSYAVSVVAADGHEEPATVLAIDDRGATVQTVAETSYVFRVRSFANGISSLEYASVSVTTPPREPTYIDLTSPSPVPAGDTVLTFQVGGLQTLQPTSGTLEVSVDGGPAQQVPVQYSRAELRVRLDPGTHSLSANYSGDGAFLPSSTERIFFAAEPLPAFASEVVDQSADLYGVVAADVTCDSRTDLVASYASSDTGYRLEVRPGRSDGTFGSVLRTPLPTDVAALYLSAGDLNGDRCADVSAVVGSEMYTFKGSPSGLGSGTLVRGAGIVYDAVLRDITGDGLLDAVVGYTGVSVLPGNGRGGFGRARTIVTSQQAWAVGDLDGDGRLDIATVDQGELHGWGQSATGEFSLRWSIWHPDPAGIAVGDVTGDGAADVVVGTDSITVIRGVDGAAVASVPGIAYTPVWNVTTGDVNGDGVGDILSVDGFYGASVGISLTWSGAPTAQQYVFPDPWLGGLRDRVLVADVTQDGRADVVLADTIGLRVLRQQ